MRKGNRKGKLLATCALALTVFGGSAIAQDAGSDRLRAAGSYQPRVERPDRGDRIERRLDRRGDLTDRRLDRAARRAHEEGRERRARQLDRRGDGIDRRLDRRGRQIDRSIDRRQDRRR